MTAAVGKTAAATIQTVLNIPARKGAVPNRIVAHQKRKGPDGYGKPAGAVYAWNYSGKAHQKGVRMKNLLLSMTLLIAAGCLHNHGEFQKGPPPKDFRGIKWGTPIEKIENMVYYVPPDQKTIKCCNERFEKELHQKCYLRVNEKLRAADVRLDKIIYHTINDTFFKVTILYTHSHPDTLKLMQRLEAKYGYPDVAPNPYQGTWQWPEFRLELDNTRGLIEYRHIEVEEKERAEVAKMKRKTINDL